MSNVELCYSGNTKDGITITVPGFTTQGVCPYGDTACSPFLRVSIQGVGQEGANKMDMVLDLEPHQRKTVFVGVVARENEVGGTTSYQTYNADLFYEGKNQNTTAEMNIKMKQFGEKFTTSRPGDLLTVFGAIGGMMGLLLSILGTVGMVIDFGADCCCPDEEEEDANEDAGAAASPVVVELGSGAQASQLHHPGQPNSTSSTLTPKAQALMQRI
jgi:hypothetical protein